MRPPRSVPVRTPPALIECLESRQLLSADPTPLAAARSDGGSKLAGIFAARTTHHAPAAHGKSVRGQKVTNLATGTWKGDTKIPIKLGPFSVKDVKLNLQVTFSDVRAKSAHVELKITGDVRKTVDATGEGRLHTGGRKAGQFAYAFDNDAIEDLKFSGKAQRLSSKNDRIVGRMSGKLDLKITTFKKAFTVYLKRPHTTA